MNLRLLPMVVLCFGAAALLGACGRAAVQSVALGEMERVRSSAGAQEGAKRAPEAYARAEQERDIARERHASGDELGAELHASRAVAAYGHALAVARLAAATADLAEAQKELDDSSAEEQALDASRARLERDAEDLAQQVRVARDRPTPASSTPATPEREAARMVAARSLAMQARLLCSAARLVAPNVTEIADAIGEITTLDERLAKSPRPTPIDDAAHARARCLDLLTRARRGPGSSAETNDALLAELSAAGGWDPARDERGVTVTLRDAFQGADLTHGAVSKLQELGRVAVAHPGFAVQLVVHDAPPAAPSETVDARRADAAVRALASGGASVARIRTELAGTRAPIVDPADARERGRNERLEVVFVSVR